MKICNLTVKCAKALFKNPSREGAKIYEQLPFAISLGYAGFSTYKSFVNEKQNNIEASRNNLLDAYVGLAATFGSIFGVGGAIIAGAGIKYLCEKSKPNMV